MDLKLSNALHIVPGDSAGGTIKVALNLSPHQLLVNEDPIACGPAPATNDLSIWRRTREQFIADMYKDWSNFSFNAFAGNGLLQNADRLQESKSVVLWAATNLEEQLLIAWTIFLLDHFGGDISKLNIIQFENLGPRQRVRTMRELSSERINEFLPCPKCLSSSELAEYRRAWSTYTSDDPTDLQAFLEVPTQVQVLHKAMRRLVHRYPSSHTGLSECDEQLLKFTREKGPAVPRIIGYAIGFNDTEDYLGDQYIFDRLRRMGDLSLKSPLVAFSGDIKTMRGCAATLTEFGGDVLSGKRNAIERNGIDDWVGGVHLKGSGNCPYRRGALLHLPS